jgi:hypothetical protein
MDDALPVGEMIRALLKDESGPPPHTFSLARNSVVRHFH